MAIFTLPEGIDLKPKAIGDLIVVLLQKGADINEIPRMIGTIVDEALDFNVIVKGPAGVALELIDGELATAIAGFIIGIGKKRLLKRAGLLSG